MTSPQIIINYQSKFLTISRELFDILREIHKDYHYDPKTLSNAERPFEFTFTLKNEEEITGYVKASESKYAISSDGFAESVLAEFPVVSMEGERIIKIIDIYRIDKVS